MAPILEAEVKGTTQWADEDFFERVIKLRVRDSTQDVTDDSVAKFLEISGLYHCDTKQWKDINPTTNEPDLYPHFLNIFQTVIQSFGISNRKAIDSHKTKMSHIEGSESMGDSDLKTSPDLFIFGTGINFHGTDVKPEPTAEYAYCASPCEIKTEHKFSEKAATQVAVYARQCFMQQANRRYVYSLVITEKRVFLLQFDRNGVLRTKDINIHERPADFVYLILLVCSPDCSILGFDTSIFWKRTKRYMRTLNEDGDFVEYEIVESRPFFYRRTVRGRGTTCWCVKDSSGRYRVIKDSWQSEGSDPEKDLLLEVKGLEGVGQMITCEARKLTISYLRGMEGRPLPNGLVDRLFRRIILKAHGRQIDQFENRKELLYAFRDAVAGHRNMFNKNIIHRDISTNNILIGGKKAKAGWRGVIIDMDMSVHREQTMAEVDFRTGTRAYQSILVISSGQDKAKGRFVLPHDYLDDLESFFYVFAWVSMHYTADGTPLEAPPLAGWESDNLQAVLDGKKSFLLAESIDPKHDEVVGNFGPTFQRLFDNLRKVVRAAYTWKVKHREQLPRKLDEMKNHSEKHYEQFLESLDKAIMELEEEDRLKRSMRPPQLPTDTQNPAVAQSSSSSSPQSPAPVPVSSPPRASSSGQHSESSGGLKRSRDKRDVDENEMQVDGEGTAPPPPKRPQTRSLSPIPVPGHLTKAIVVTKAAPVARRSTRSRTGATQSGEANIQENVAPPALRWSTRSRTGATTPTQAPAAIATSSIRTRSRSRNSSTSSGRKQTTSREATIQPGSSGARVRTQSSGATGFRCGRSATRKSKS